MGRSCCVRGCRSNYTVAEAFKFPEDRSLQQKWIRNIHREKLEVKDQTIVGYVCNQNLWLGKISFQPIMEQVPWETMPSSTMSTTAIHDFRRALHLFGETTTKHFLPYAQPYQRDCVRSFKCQPGNVPTVKFNNGEIYPQLGYGTSRESREDLIKGVKDAIDIGYRHIDCATVNKNEADIGKAIADKIEEGAVERNDLYITSKLWNTHHRGDMVIPSLEKSLEDLCLDYLDLYLIQWPMAYKEGSNTCPMKNGQTLYSEVEYTETWKAMEKAVKQGLVKSIGLSNFNSEQVLRVLAVSEIKPVTNQVECHPYLNQKKMKELCDSFNITLTAFSSLGSGDRPWAKSDEPRLLEDTTLAKIAGKYKKSPAQILLRYQIQQGNIVLVRSVIKPLSKENFEIFDFNIHSSDMAKLDGMDRNYRYIHCNWDKGHIDYPFNIEF